MAQMTFRQLISVVAVGAFMVGSGCTEAEQLIEEQTDGTLDLSEIDLSEITIPDLNDPDFTLPDLIAPEFVAPEISINIDDLMVDAPDVLVIRFPDAIIIEIREITSPAVTVAETPDETIYTIDGQVLFDFDRADLRPEVIRRLFSAESPNPTLSTLVALAEALEMELAAEPLEASRVSYLPLKK